VSPERWSRQRKLFENARHLDPQAAEEYLRKECGNEEQLLQEVQQMLEEERRTGPLDREPLERTPAPYSSASEPVFRAGQVVARRYRILRYVNRGGMGEVYEAQDLELPDEHVALKTLLPGIAADDAMIARFKQEIQLARKVAHPNVCRVFNLDQHEVGGEGGPAVRFLVMEFLAGEPLSARLEREGRMTPAGALPLIEQMAEALDAAHRAGVIHRDFKTSNVMLVPSGGGVRAVVTDFGLARSVATDAETTASLTRNIAGTLEYMSPELISGSVASFRSDIYALGVVAYKMITGVLPFAGEAPLAAAFLRSRGPVPSPRTLVPDLDPKWEHAIVRALDRDPGRRYGAVLEFPRALRGESVSMTVSLPYISRRRIWAGACVAAALAAGGAGWLAWRSWRSQLTPEAARFYQQGVDDIHAGAYFAATKALEQVVQIAPSYAPARARYAESWLELDLPERALREFALVHRQDTSALARLDRLQIDAIDRTITREFPAAASKYEEMRKSTGESADLNIDLGRIYEKAGKSDQAIAAYRRAAEGPAHSPAAWLRLGVIYSIRKMQPESEAAFAESERRYQQTSNLEGITELTLQRGVAANRANRFPEASALLRKAMEHAHDAGNLQQEISAKLTLANVSYKGGDTALAETLAREALATAQANQMESLTIRGFINLGTSYFVKGDFKGAEQQYQNALSLAQRTNSSRLAALAQLNLASLYDQLHRSDDQIREAKEALNYFQPNRWVQETFTGLALLGRAERHRGNYSAALESFQKLLDESTRAQDRANIAIAQEGLGNVFSVTENYPKALEHYRELLALSDSPRSIGYAARDCAITLARLGLYDEARTEFSKAENAAKTVAILRPSLAQYRAEISLTQNLHREVIQVAETALSSTSNLNPLSEAEITRLLGLALLRSGNPKSGLTRCEKAFAAAQKLNDPDELLDTRLALVEAFLSTHDVSRASAMLHDLESLLNTHPERGWRAFAQLGRSDPRYIGRAKEALKALENLWGRDAVSKYLKRPDLQNFSRHLFPGNSAKRL
jgi:tetratricopeptide (TPR) repeat protein/tRNA A-37 threonylcarbamoyl transferase component Bud32